MATRVDDVLQELSTDLAKHGFDVQRTNRAVAQLQALPVETEEDRRLIMAGYMRLADAVLPLAPNDTAASIRAEREQMQARFDQMYGRVDSPYAATVRITAELAKGLKKGRPADELEARASAELAALPFDGSQMDGAVEMNGKYRVMALLLASDWSREHERGEYEDEPFAKTLEDLWEALQRDGFDKTLIIDAAQAVVQTAGDPQNLLGGLLLVWGMGLLLRPDAAPSVEAVGNLVLSVAEQVFAQRAGVQEAPAPPAPLAGAPARYDAILREMKALLERDGFSLYAYQQATAAIQEVPIESDEDLAAMYDTLLGMNDLAMAYTTGENAQALAAMRPILEEMMALAALEEIPALTADEMRARTEAVLRELRENLEAGEPASVAATRAMAKLQLLGMQMGGEEEGEESLRVFMAAMQQILPALQPHIPEGTDNVFAETVPLLDSLTPALDVNPDDAAGNAILDAQVEEQTARFLQAGVAQSETQKNPNKVADLPHVRQFAALIPDLWDRINLVFQSHDGKDEKAEAERLHQRLDRALRAIQDAYSEEQLVRHQREALRGAVLQLRQFERRRHLMILRPVFPTNVITVDPNEVFFSGTDAVAALVKAACDTLGMHPSVTHGLQNRTHGRWQQLRGSGVAIFDYTAYDPARADPRGEVRRWSKEEDRVLSAAGPVASVAYENGWAYALGTPMVIVARKGQAVPFDVDIEPVLLEGDGGDVERIIAALQAAFYGAQHGLGGDCLAETLERARRLYGSHKDSQLRALLSALTDADDAARVRMILSAVAERAEEKPLLAFPTFPGDYPADGARELFHVTAFRSWSKGLQDEARAACVRAGVDYRVGYERLSPDIIRVIWKDICRAAFVIADITNLNPNAVMELAMAQAVGRPTLILTRNTQLHAYLHPVQKVRTHYYDPDEGRGDLSTLLDAFIAGKD